MKLLKRDKTAIKEQHKNEEFCVLISTYRVNMYRLAKSILRHETDAEDAVSEAILRAYTNLPKLKKMESFKPWIMKILVNESYKIINRKKKILYLDEMEVPEEVRMHDHGELWQMVAGLEEEFRMVTILFYYEDMSLKNISKILELPLGTVKSRLSRARKKLKKILEREGVYQDERL